MKTFKEHYDERNYVEYHLINGKKVILKNPRETKAGFISGHKVISRTNTSTVHGTKKAITKQYIIGKSAIKKSVDLKHDLTYDELVDKNEE